MDWLGLCIRTWSRGVTKSLSQRTQPSRSSLEVHERNRLCKLADRRHVYPLALPYAHIAQHLQRACAHRGLPDWRLAAGMARKRTDPNTNAFARFELVVLTRTRGICGRSATSIDSSTCGSLSLWVSCFLLSLRIPRQGRQNSPGGHLRSFQWTDCPSTAQNSRFGLSKCANFVSADESIHMFRRIVDKR